MEPKRVFGEDKQVDNIVIMFRSMNDPPPPDSWIGDRWQVEAYLVGEHCAPVGLLWIVFPPFEGGSPMVEYLRVFPEFQRRGIATALVDAAFERWPNLELGDGVSDEG